MAVAAPRAGGRAGTSLSYMAARWWPAGSRQPHWECSPKASPYDIPHVFFTRLHKELENLKNTFLVEQQQRAAEVTTLRKEVQLLRQRVKKNDKSHEAALRRLKKDLTPTYIACTPTTASSCPPTSSMAKSSPPTPTSMTMAASAASTPTTPTSSSSTTRSEGTRAPITESELACSKGELIYDDYKEDCNNVGGVAHLTVGIKDTYLTVSINHITINKFLQPCRSDTYDPADFNYRYRNDSPLHKDDDNHYQYDLADVLSQSQALFGKTDATMHIDDRIAVVFDDVADLIPSEGDLHRWLQHMRTVVARAGRVRVSSG